MIIMWWPLPLLSTYPNLLDLHDANVVPHILLEREVDVVQERVVAHLQHQLVRTRPAYTHTHASDH